MKHIYCLLLAALLTACASGPVQDPLPAYVATSPTRTLAEVQHGFKQGKDQFTKLFISNHVPSGTLYVALTIEPNGSVSDCHAVASDFSPSVTDAVMGLVRTLQFGSRQVPSYSMPDYPIIYKLP
ncbi:MAG: hypothetical protein Q8Q73_17185 [Stagnimonas sp.]|nr:hypothetical protein [Stagnimonas sp.]